MKAKAQCRFSIYIGPLLYTTEPWTVFDDTLVRPELLARPYYINVDMSKYIALLVDHINHDISISELLDPVGRINKVLNAYRNR